MPTASPDRPSMSTLPSQPASNGYQPSPRDYSYAWGQGPELKRQRSSLEMTGRAGGYETDPRYMSRQIDPYQAQAAYPPQTVSPYPPQQRAYPQQGMVQGYPMAGFPPQVGDTQIPQNMFMPDLKKQM